jgi:inosine/xanthosine triphosphate pyrophosphatase family protein
MKYTDKTKEQRIIEDLEAKETKRKKAEFVSNVYLVDHK